MLNVYILYSFISFTSLLQPASSYIKYFGYVQFAGVIASPLTGLLFREQENGHMSAKEDFVNKVKTLILPGFVLIFILTLMDALQILGSTKLSVSDHHTLSLYFTFILLLKSEIHLCYKLWDEY